MKKQPLFNWILAVGLLLNLVLSVTAVGLRVSGIGTAEPLGVIINGKKVLGGTVYVDEVRATGSGGLKLYDDSGTAGLQVLDGGNTSAGDKDITNVADIALDSISSDAGTTVNVDLGSDAGDDFTVDTNKLVVEGDHGNVGIGTTGPGVDVIGTTDASGKVVELRDTSQRVSIIVNADPATLNLIDSAGGTNDKWAVLEANDGNIEFYSVNDNGTLNTGDILVMDLGTGNVGIGITGPNHALDVTGTIGIGNPAALSSGTMALVFANAIVTPTLAVNTAGLWALDDGGGTVKLYAADEDDNVALLTPHKFSLFTPDSDEKYPWSYYACNRVLGTCINVDMAGAIREIEALSGKQFIYYEDIPEDEIRSWDEHQQTEAERINAERLAEAAAVLTPTLRIDAVEAYSETVTQPVRPTQYITTTTASYEFDNETGEMVEVTEVTTETVTEEVATGRTLYRLKDGCQLDTETGQFMCPVGEENAVYEPDEPQPMPDWMATRFETLFLAPQDVSGIEKPEGGEYRKLIDIGPSAALWVAKSHEAEALLSVHDQLWALDPAGTFGLLAAVKESGESFYDKRVRIATGMTVQEALARRNRIANYLDTLGKDTTALRAAMTEDAQVIAIVEALGFTEQALWNAME